MAKLYKKTKQGVAGTVLRKVAGEKTFDDFHFLGHKAELARDAENAADAEANKPAIPLPDEDELARIRRRRARRSTGRASTQLTGDSETFGPA